MSYFPTDNSYQQIILDNDITLIWPFFPSIGDITITDIMEVVPDENGRKVILPNATLTQNGQNFLLNNVSEFSFELIANDETTVVGTIKAGSIVNLYLYDNGTKNGLWRVIAFGEGTNAITSLTAKSSDASVSITNGSISPPGGVIDFKLTSLITNLVALKNSGFPVITEYPELMLRSLVAGNNISIDNSDGKDGNPIINLSNSLTNLTSIAVGGIKIANAEIASDIDSNLKFSTSGIGKIELNGVTIDSNSNIAGTFTNGFVAKAWCIFSDTVTGNSNTIVNEASENIASITGSNGRYVITFNNAMSSINYGVIITLGSNGDALPPPVYHVFFTVRETGSVTIAVLDASGEFVKSFPYGVTVNIMSN